ncbi:MAG: hypothetical protein ACK53A_09915 [Gemmatimonadota bacterium]|jgi:hypothetical protein|nr:hypothetical protein [Gemmatimonadota bacterium]
MSRAAARQRFAWGRLAWGRLAWGQLLASAGFAASAFGQAPLPAPDLARLAQRRDSLVAITSSGRVGWWRMSRAPTDDGGVRYVETMRVADDVDLTTLLVTDASLALRQLRQTGEAWEQSVLVTLDVRDGRLTGMATSAGSRAGALVPRDATAPAAPDLNAVPLLVIATPWRDGAAGQWRVMDAVTGGDVTLAVSVEGFEPASATDPAAWRVAVRRDAATTRYRVSAEAPWRLLGIATEGMPFHFTLP